MASALESNESDGKKKKNQHFFAKGDPNKEKLYHSCQLFHYTKELTSHFL